tara:strand:- start:624 stop:1298 length:675 start_codon:yes stop_codon:yes gene_type:complete
MTRYDVDKGFIFKVDPGATYELLWRKICECLKEELGDEGKDAVFEKSGFDTYRDKVIINVVNSKDQLIAICKSTAAEIVDEPQTTVWMGQILCRDAKGNPVIAEESDDEAEEDIGEIGDFFDAFFDDDDFEDSKEEGSGSSQEREPEPSRKLNSVLSFLGYVTGGLLVFTGIFPAITDLFRLILGREPIDFTTLDPTYPVRFIGGVLLIALLDIVPKIIKNKKG